MAPAFIPALAARPRGAAARPLRPCRRARARAPQRAAPRMLDDVGQSSTDLQSEPAGLGESMAAADASPLSGALSDAASRSAPAPPPPPAPGPDAAQEAAGDVRQLLGIKGADQSTDKWRVRLQLMKPVTWVPLIWGVSCGAAASGHFDWSNPQHIAQAIFCMVLAGPLLTGYTQVINDWYDRDIDAINEPYRPIPAGIVSETEVKTQIAVLLALGLSAGGILDLWAHHDWPINFTLAIFGSLVAYVYSAPPLKLKQNGWTGSYALGASYISLPWWAGQALFGTLDWKIVVLTLFYSFAGLGIAIINDFKSVDGDRETGMQSIPVMFGVENAKWITVAMIDVFQLLVAGILYSVGEKAYGAGIAGLVAPQMFLQWKYFLKDPVKYDVKYQASAQPFLVIGILVAGLAIGHHGPL